MSTVTLQDILGGPNLCGVIRGTATGIPSVFPEGFYQIDKTVDRDTGQYTRVTGTRTVARIAAYGSPSQQRQLKGVEAVPVKLIHSVESILLSTTDYLNLLQYDDTAAQTRGIQEVTRQVREFRANFDNLRVAAPHADALPGRDLLGWQRQPAAQQHRRENRRQLWGA